MNYFIFDNPNDKNVMKFIINNPNYTAVFPKNKLSSIFDYISYSKYVLRLTSKQDVLIFWYDFLGVIFNLVKKVFLKKRKIIILNILLKNKSTLKNKIVRSLYRKTLNDKRILSTVCSLEYGKYLNHFLKIKKDYSVLYDPCHFKSTNETIFKGNYVFCGGRNGRDWAFMYKVAKEMNNQNFCFVMNKKDFDIFNIQLENVKVYYDVSKERFNELLQNSMFVAMPLNTEAPAGLLAFYDACYYGKAIITTKTVTTEEIFKNDRGILCENSVVEWKDRIDYLSKNSIYCQGIASNFKEFLLNECSEENYLKNVDGLIKRSEELWLKKN